MITEFGTVAITLYAAHHVGDYWVQTDHQARHKAGSARACLAHVGTYVATQAVMLAVAGVALDLRLNPWMVALALLVSGVTHYIADRRRPLHWLASLIPGKLDFWSLGSDRPNLATGAWALDQSWHIFWGVWVAALIAVTA